MIVARLAPAVLLGSVAGVFVDGRSRKRILVWSNPLQAGIVTLLLLVPGEGWLWVVFAVAAAQSVLASFSSPAESALLPALVDESELMAANALNTLNNRIARLAGAPLGGALLASLGLEAVVVVDAATFVAAAALIAPIAAPGTPRGVVGVTSAWESFWVEWLKGLATRRPRLRDCAPLRRLRADDVRRHHARPADGGVGARRAPRGPAGVRVDSDRARRQRDLRVALRRPARPAAETARPYRVGLAGRGRRTRAEIQRAVGRACAGAVGGRGVTSVASSIGAETLAMQSVPDEFRCRFFGSLTATLGLLSLAGAAAGGLLAEVVGIVPMLNVAVALTALAGLVVLRAYAR
jgi:hypothetical protein